MNVQPNFNRLARLYRWMELFTFGPCLERCRRAFLADMAERRRALALGDGDRRFAAQLLRANADVQIDAVDFSPEMLSALVSRADLMPAACVFIVPTRAIGNRRTGPTISLSATFFSIAFRRKRFEFWRFGCAARSLVPRFGSSLSLRFRRAGLGGWWPAPWFGCSIGLLEFSPGSPSAGCPIMPAHCAKPDSGWPSAVFGCAACWSARNGLVSKESVL